MLIEASTYIEQLAIEELMPGKRLTLPCDQAFDLLRTGWYEPSVGSPPWAGHYRRALPDGGCLHLVIHSDRATVHRDRWDPHRDLISLLRHCVLEAPVETTITIGVVAVVGSLLLRSG